MVVLPHRLRWVQMLFRVRDTVLMSIWPRVLSTTLLACIVTYLHNIKGFINVSLTPLPFTFIGLALSIFLGFRNSTSYERFWEGRKLWGCLVNNSRSLTRQVMNYLQVPPEQEPQLKAFQHTFIYTQIAYVHALRLHLRDTRNYDELMPFLSPEIVKELYSQVNPPIFLLNKLSQMINQAWRSGWLHTYHVNQFEQCVKEMTDLQGSCERIRSTPIPFAYVALLHQMVGIYCFAMPLGIVESVNYYTPFVVMDVSYSFLGLDAIGDSIEDPFNWEPHDLPLNAISRTIEINLRQSLGETELPPPEQPDENWILM